MMNIEQLHEIMAKETQLEEKFREILGLLPLDEDNNFHHDIDSDVASELVNIRFFSWIDVERKRLS